MTDPALVLRKLASLREQVTRLRRRRPGSVEAFRDDVDLQDATAMSLMVAVQEAVDVALHVVSDEGFGLPASYAEGFDILASRGVIEAPLARRLAAMVALRNRVAHGYASVDVARIWGELPAGVEALEAFAAALASWVEPPGSASG